MCFGRVFVDHEHEVIESLGFRPGQRALEVGVGTGISLDAYPPYIHLTAIDPSDSMLAHAVTKTKENNWRHIDLRNGDAQALEFPDNSFDWVLTFHVMTVVPDPRRMMSEMIRVCKPGGRIVVITHFASPNQTVCVQGAPGTGKTAVGLHRVAYLLYAHKEQVTRRGVIVVGPNLAFLSYIRNVLPALGELDVSQATITDLVASVPVRGADSDEAALVKGDARMAEVLRRALWASIRPPGETLVVARGARRWRVPTHEIESLAAELRERGVRYGSGRELLGHRIAHVILTQMEAAGETCDDRTHDAVRRSAPVRACVTSSGPKSTRSGWYSGCFRRRENWRGTLLACCRRPSRRRSRGRRRRAVPGRPAGAVPTWC